MEWINVNEYCKLKNIKNPQTVYNTMYMNRLKKDEDWIEVDIIVKKKLVKYE